MTIRVLVVDDQEMVRTGFSTILELEADVEVVGHAADGEAALAQVEALHPDVVLMDVQMPGTDGLTATRELTRRSGESGTGPAVVVLTTFDRDDYLFAALEAGAAGFLLKNAGADDLVAAVRAAARGDALLDQAVTRRVIARFAGRPARSGRPDLQRLLTERELEVLVLIAEGLSNTELAARLYVSEATVKTHVSRVLSKLGLRDRVQAVVHAYETGLVGPQDEAGGRSRG